MYNVLIIEKDLEYSKKIINYIAMKFEKIRVVAIAMTIDEVIQILKLSNINIIILNVDLFSYEKIEKISTKYKVKLLCVGENDINNINIYKYKKKIWKICFLS